MAPAGEATAAALRRAGARPLLLDLEGEHRTGDEIAERVERVASALAQRRLAGRRIGLWYGNGFAAVEAFLAVERIGGTRVPVDPGAATAEAQAVFDAAGVDAVLASAALAPRLAGDPLVHDDDAPLADPRALEPVPEDPDATLHLYPRMASGGELFGVPIAYRNWEANLRVNEALFRSGRYGPGFDDDERFVTAQQLMHGTGPIGSFPFLRMGLPQIVLERFAADDVLEACERLGATATFFVPGMLTRLADASRGRRGAPRLRRVLYGGAPISVDEIRDAVDRLGPVLTQLYGRFEGGWPLATLDVDDHAAIASGDDELGRSCGRPIAEVEVRLRPVAGTPEGGELQVRSDMVVADYADPDGWCALGDLAARDERGYISLRGRLDGMINTGSYHVYPDEVEEAIGAVDGVREVRVVGEPDPTWGQAVTAYVVAADDHDDDLGARIDEQLPRRLAKYKIPKAVHVVPALGDGGGDAA